MDMVDRYFKTVISIKENIKETSLMVKENTNGQMETFTQELS
jgi:hypothetical protein